MKTVKTEKSVKPQKWHLLLIPVFLLGACVFAYPSVSQWYEGRKSVLAVQSYDQAAGRISEETYKKMWQEAQAYNEQLRGHAIKDPFTGFDSQELPSGYKDMLNIDGMMGYIEIPKIGARLPIYHGTSDDVLQKGVGHLEGSALPIGSERSHVLLTGHTGLPEAKLFTDLVDMEVGDQFNIRVLNKELVYQTDRIRVVEPDDVSELIAGEDGDYVTLITCTPYGINSHRLLVRGKHIYTLTKQLRLKSYYFRWIFVGGGNEMIFMAAFFVLLGTNSILLLVLLGNRRKKRRYLAGRRRPPPGKTETGDL